MDKNDPNINKVIFSDYLIQKKIGKGSFGTVYSGIIISKNQKVALKLEKRKGDSPGLLETEACRLYLLQGEGIPKIICYGNNRTDNILIQELLGHSLEEIFNTFSKKFTLKTVCNIGIQLIKRIKHVHKKHHVHRDLKPDNFMTGYYKSDNKIYLIDFGLSKKYYSSSKKQHIKLKFGKNLVGTARYCSRNAHKGYELSRRDDIESIGYCLIYFLKGMLPWQGIKVKKIGDQFKKIAEKKLQTSFEELTKDLPKEFLEFLRHSNKLSFEDEPNYDYLIALFKNAISKYCTECNYEYDWKKKVNNENGNNSSNNNAMILKMIFNNDKNVSMLVNDNNLSNNLSGCCSKGEEKENKGDNNNNNDNIKISNIILSKDFLQKENDGEINIDINKYINKIKREENNNNNNNEILEEKKDEEINKNNKLRKQQSEKFLSPKKLEDFFSEGDFKSEEMSSNNNNNDTNEKETNHVNIEKNDYNSNENKDDDIINNDNENKENNKIINNFNINININKEDKNKNEKNNKNISNNVDNKIKNNIIYEYEFGIIENKKRNRNKIIEGNINHKKIDKENDIKCDCSIV